MRPPFATHFDTSFPDVGPNYFGGVAGRLYCIALSAAFRSSHAVLSSRRFGSSDFPFAARDGTAGALPRPERNTTHDIRRVYADRPSSRGQPLRRVEAARQRGRAAGPPAGLLRRQDRPQLSPVGGGPSPAADTRQHLAPARQRRLPGLRLCPDQLSGPRLRAPAVLLPYPLEERLGDPDPR